MDHQTHRPVGQGRYTRHIESKQCLMATPTRRTRHSPQDARKTSMTQTTLNHVGARQTRFWRTVFERLSKMPAI